MNKRLIISVGVGLAVPSALFAKGAVETRVRMRNYQMMNKTVEAMHGLVVATAFYSQEHNGKLPPMKNAAVLRRALVHYATKDSFVSPASGTPFVPNSTLAGRTLDSLSNQTALFYDVKPLSGPNSPKQLFRVVGFKDHVKTVPEFSWPATKTLSGIR